MRSVRTILGEPFAGLDLHHAEWGLAAAPPVVCVHGLTRNGRDFDALAAALAGHHRVFCVDVAGRGQSSWLDDPAQYQIGVYAQQLTLWMRTLGLPRVAWVGTSMGGIIGMALAAQPDTPIERLVVNDVGAFIPKSALAAIASYVGLAPVFASLHEVEAYLRTIHAGFGALSDAQWHHLAMHSAKPADDGWRLLYDPAVQAPMAADPEDIDLWPVWDAIRCPTLVLRGGDSGLLLPETADEMMGRGPPAELVTFAGVGHAPALMEAEQIDVVRSFLVQRPSRP